MSNYRTDWFAPQRDGQLMEGRFVYLSLAKKRTKDFDNKEIPPADQYYEATILFPKAAGDSVTTPFVGPVALVQRAWQAWTMDPQNGGQWRQGARWPILDCDAVNHAGEKEPFSNKNPWARGHWRIVPWSMYPPRVVDQTNNDIQRDVYGEFLAFKSGDYGYASLNCFSYGKGSGGINFGIEGAKKSRDGDAVGGTQRSPEQMFGGPPPAAAAPPLPGSYGPAAAPSAQAPFQQPPGQYGAPPAQPQYAGPPQGFPPGQYAGPPQGQPARGPAAPTGPAYGGTPGPGGAAAPGNVTPYPSSPPQQPPASGQPYAPPAQPQYGAPQYGAPPQGAPPQGAPVYGQQPYAPPAQPQYGAPQYGAPQYGAPPQGGMPPPPPSFAAVPPGPPFGTR